MSVGERGGSEPDVAELKQAHRRTWAAGDYARVAETLAEAPPRHLLDRVGIEPGMEVLDVATGTGNVAILAAQRGARVVGLDLVPELLAGARQAAAEAGVGIDWVEGDAEQMPFDDGRFDRVLSAFGVMFAPRHQVAANELVRVTKPGGVIGVINWTPWGIVGQVSALLGGYMPAPPSYASPAALWGDPAHVGELFAGSGVELEFELGIVPTPFDSADAYVHHFEQNYGPAVIAKQRLESEGRWEDFRRRYVDLVESFGRQADGSFKLEREYLLSVGSRNP